MSRLSNLRGDLEFPERSFELQAVGTFQNQIEANRRFLWIVPTVILIDLLLHYLHFRNLPVSLVVFPGIPVAAAGGMILVAVMGVELNTAMWVGLQGCPAQQRHEIGDMIVVVERAGNDHLPR